MIKAGIDGGNNRNPIDDRSVRVRDVDCCQPHQPMESTLRPFERAVRQARLKTFVDQNAGQQVASAVVRVRFNAMRRLS